MHLLWIVLCQLGVFEANLSEKPVNYVKRYTRMNIITYKIMVMSQMVIDIMNDWDRIYCKWNFI